MIMINIIIIFKLLIHILYTVNIIIGIGYYSAYCHDFEIQAYLV